jgi:ribose 1,5-bisphosphokinase
VSSEASRAGAPAEPRHYAGSGRLVLVVGPSGAGKDTLLALAKAALAARHDIVFQRRVVTRASGQGEDHDSLTPEAFAEVRRCGAFVLAWHAHGLDYGIPQRAMELVRDGRTVVCNASRSIATEARARFPGTSIVYITALSEIRARRLAARRRETTIAERIERELGDNVQSTADLVIDNSEAAEESAAHLVTYLAGLTCARPHPSEQ